MKSFKVLGYIITILFIIGLIYGNQNDFLRYLIVGLALLKLGYSLYKDLSRNKQ